jgi:hypothetical protein
LNLKSGGGDHKAHRDPVSGSAAAGHLIWKLRAGTPMTAREIADALLAEKAPQATRKQAIDLQAAVLAALRKRNGAAVIGEGSPTEWTLSKMSLPNNRAYS